MSTLLDAKKHLEECKKYKNTVDALANINILIERHGEGFRIPKNDSEIPEESKKEFHGCGWWLHTLTEKPTKED